VLPGLDGPGVLVGGVVEDEVEAEADAGRAELTGELG
jgi:hypothetical protein